MSRPFPNAKEQMPMEITVQSPGGQVMEARFNEFKIATDQPLADGGTNTAPSPFDLFLASLATCAGCYVTAFCRERGLPTEGIVLKMTNDWNDLSHRVASIAITIELPDGFPAKYERAVSRAAGMCTVKRHMEKPPAFVITTRNGRSA
jgi:ribosomal protein S12 methylthiotransferase accessory factor